MIKIPSDSKKISQPNTSDLFGNIFYSKSLNLKEPGYIKLNSRTVQLISSKDDSDFDLVQAFGRYSDGNFLLACADNPYTLSVDNQSLAIAQDVLTGAPNTTPDSYGVWWEKNWYVSSNTTVDFRAPTDVAWTNTGITLTANRTHVMEVFRNKNNLAIANGNQVILVDNSYVTQATLTLPADFEVIGLSYSNNRMGIVTRLSDSTEGENQDAFFFVWDGATLGISAGEANYGFPVGSDAVESIVAYKSSWVILNRKGQLLQFNGGGFDVIATLPFYYIPITWGDEINKLMYGNTLQVDGDQIYVNINNDINIFGKNGESYIPNYIAGVLCYDPNIGLYHAYAPSVSQASFGDSSGSGVDSGTHTITLDNGTPTDTGTQVLYTEASDTPYAALDVSGAYYVIKISSTEFKAAATYADALAGVPIAVLPTSAGGSHHYFMFLDSVDYGISSARSINAGIGLQAQKTYAYDKILFSGSYRNVDANNNSEVLCMSVPYFPNIGYFVTPKITSGNLEDMYPSAFLKFGTLKDNESITIKYKTKELVNFPVTTTQQNFTGSCTWIDTTSFSTAHNFSDVLTNFNNGGKMECEIISGSGAGQMAQISNITFSSGTYTVTLDEVIEAGITSNVCDVCIDTWTKEKGITNSSNYDGYAEIPVGVPSKWIQFKVVLRGFEVTVEEFLVNNTKQK